MVKAAASNPKDCHKIRALTNAYALAIDEAIGRMFDRLPTELTSADDGSANIAGVTRACVAIAAATLLAVKDGDKPDPEEVGKITTTIIKSMVEAIDQLEQKKTKETNDG